MLRPRWPNNIIKWLSHPDEPSQRVQDPSATVSLGKVRHGPQGAMSQENHKHRRDTTTSRLRATEEPGKELPRREGDTPTAMETSLLLICAFCGKIDCQHLLMCSPTTSFPYPPRPFSGSEKSRRSRPRERCERAAPRSACAPEFCMRKPRSRWKSAYFLGANFWKRPPCRKPRRALPQLKKLAPAIGTRILPVPCPFLFQATNRKSQGMGFDCPSLIREPARYSKVRCFCCLYQPVWVPGLGPHLHLEYSKNDIASDSHSWTPLHLSYLYVILLCFYGGDPRIRVPQMSRAIGYVSKAGFGPPTPNLGCLPVAVPFKQAS